MTQDIILLLCLRCNGLSHGLSLGAASAVRKLIWNNEQIHICTKCRDESEKRDFDRKITEYYHQKSR